MQASSASSDGFLKQLPSTQSNWQPAEVYLTTELRVQPSHVSAVAKNRNSASITCCDDG
jgi:hypothetical protein